MRSSAYLSVRFTAFPRFDVRRLLAPIDGRQFGVFRQARRKAPWSLVTVKDSEGNVLPLTFREFTRARKVARWISDPNGTEFEWSKEVEG